MDHHQQQLHQQQQQQRLGKTVDEREYFQYCHDETEQLLPINGSNVKYDRRYLSASHV